MIVFMSFVESSGKTDVEEISLSKVAGKSVAEFTKEVLCKKE